MEETDTSDKRVAVVGGGIVGLCTAWQLCQRGYDVTVLEKTATVATAGTSFNPCGIFGGVKCDTAVEGDKFKAPIAAKPWRILKTMLPGHSVGSTAVLMDRRFLREAQSWKFALCFFKRLCIDQPLRKFAFKCSHNAVGSWLLTRLTHHSIDDFSSDRLWPVSDSSRQLFFRKVYSNRFWAEFFAQNREFLEDTAVLGRDYVTVTGDTQKAFEANTEDSIRAEYREQFDSANSAPQFGTALKCNKFVEKMAELCEASGKVSVVCNKQVSGIVVDDSDSVSGVRTADGDWLPFDRVVLCTGLWTPALLRAIVGKRMAAAKKVARMWFPIVALQGFTVTHSFHSEDYSLPFHSVVWSDSSIYLHAAFYPEFDELNSTGFAVFRPMSFALNYSQSGESPKGFPNESAVFEALEREINDSVLPLFSCEANPKSKWAGFRPLTPDEFPVVCAVPRVNGLFVNAGHGRCGIVTGMSSAHLLATLLHTPKCQVPALEKALLNAMSLQRFRLKPYLL